MSVRSICQEPHPVLRRKARPVDTFTEELVRLAADLIETMYAHDGIGIAAPQIGCDLQLVVANPTQRRGQELVLVNPALDASHGRTALVEGCLSLPDTWGRVKRSAWVRMRAQDLAGQPLTVEADAMLAIVLQHEFDHLQGRLFIDRLSWFRRLQVRRALACA